MTKDESRLRRLTDRERAACEQEGMMLADSSVHSEGARNCLIGHGIDAEAARSILDQLGEPVGNYLAQDGWIRTYLTPSEAAAQARMTAAIAGELAERIRFMEPSVAGRVAIQAHQSGHGAQFADSGVSWLLAMKGYCEEAADGIDNEAPRTAGRRTEHRDRLFRLVVDTIGQHAPALPVANRHEAATGLMECWHVPIPSDEREIRRIVAGETLHKT